MAPDESDRRNDASGDRKFSDENISLVFRTRGNSEPYGKPRVYLACHPADLSSYRDEIIEDIFRTQNCVIFWRDPKKLGTREPQGLPQGRIALVVFAVTSRLLTEPNTAMDTEFPEALSRHIPVLPLLMEEGLDALFGKKFGTLQYLQKNTQDITAISYDIKLEQFLNRILIGDREAEQIRAAFSAHVFLSYRKKDRGHAQRLMHLVHEREEFRDVAIWYDEYLIPGESFSESIDKMLRNCDLFLLAITPNLVNERNYVVEVEYPDAVRYDRKILPAEIVSLNEGETARLYVWFPGIKDPAATPEQIYSLLSSLPRRLQGSENPQHELLIGLAYLKGIDMEVDNERALHLIKEAADRGLTDAMEQLGNMYSSGEGVVRDFDQSIFWFKTLVETLRRRQTPADGQELFRAMRRLEEAYKDAGKIDDAERTCSEALKIAQTSEGSWTTGATGDALLDLGYYAYERKDLAGSGRYYDQAEKLFDQEGLELSIGIVCERQSLLARKKGDFRAAARYLEKALQIREQEAVKDSANSHNQNALALSYLLMGDLVRKEDTSVARTWYDRALDMYRILAGETRSPAARDGLAVTLCAIAEIGGDNGNRNVYWQEAYDILKQLYEETGRKLYKTKILICEINLKGVQSFLEEHLGDNPEEDNPEPAPGERAARAQKCLEDEDYAGAAELLKQEYDALRKKVYDEHHDSWENRLSMYTHLLRAGRCYGKAGMMEDAENCFGRIRKYARPEEGQEGRFYFADGKGNLLRSICAEACIRLAEFSKDQETTEAMLDECLQELHRIYEKEPGAESLLDLAEGYRLSGANPLIEDADIYMEEAVRFCKRGLTEFPDDKRFTVLNEKIKEG